MSELISYEEAVILKKHGIDVLMMDKNHTPELWVNFINNGYPSSKETNFVYMKKFNTKKITIETAEPCKKNGEYYKLTTVIQKFKVVDGFGVACEDLKRSRPIANFKTYIEADEVCKSLISAFQDQLIKGG